MEERVHRGDLTHPCANCLSRRAFLGQAALGAAAAAVLAACGDGQIGGGGPTGPVSKVTVKVADFSGLATTGKLVNINAQIAAKRTGAATFVAWSRSCTHEGTQVDIVSTGFFCSNHGSQFDSNGQVTVGPAARPLVSLAASYDAATDLLTIS
ncbi:MAG TPA: Rieske 2Fe-2S domain-containing protein [Gemmatimonadaceae bacterium]